MAAAAMCWVLSANGAWSKKVLPVAVVAVGGLQVVPFPDAVLLNLSPMSAGLWKAASPLAWGTIAVDPAATASGLRRLLLCLGTIGAVAAFGRHAALRSWLLAAITLSCALTLVLALSLRPSLYDRMILGFIDLSGPIDFWKSPVHAPVQSAGFAETTTTTIAGYSYATDSWIVGDRIGPYVVSNHFAGAMSLMLPIGIAFLSWVSRGRLPGMIRFGMGFTMAGIALFAVASIAKSRAGTASLILALMSFIAILSTTRVARTAAASVTAAGVASWLLMVAMMYGPIADHDDLIRWGLPSQFIALVTDSRVWATRLALRIFTAAPVFGAGFGSYYALSAYLDPQNAPWYFTHNDYAQFLAETGLVGATAAVACGAGLAKAAWEFDRRAAPPDRVRDAGCWAALVGIAAHSAFDWNFHVPANGFLACVVAGLALSSTPSEAGRGRPGDDSRRIPARMPGVMLAMAYFVCLVLLARDAWSDALQRTMRDALVVSGRDQSHASQHATPPYVDEALAFGERLNQYDPGNANVAVLMGKLHLRATQDAGAASVRFHREAAETWFSRAQRRAAVIRGLPYRCSDR